MVFELVLSWYFNDTIVFWTWYHGNL